MEKTDAALIAETLARDEEAFCVLVRRYQNYAYAAAIGILSDFDLAQDVAQEAFLAAYLDLRKLEEPERFAVWLRGIVRYKAFRVVKERERARALVEAYGPMVPVAANTVRPDRKLEAEERREMVQGALDRLEPKNREAVSLYYIDGFSYDDIANFLGVTPATVKGRLQRGRAQLREEMQMVEKTVHDQRLPDAFAGEIRRILAAWSKRGRASQDEIQRLVEIGEPAVDPLCEVLELRDAPIRIRRAATNVLSEIGDPRSLGAVLETARRIPLRNKKRLLQMPGLREALLRIVRSGDDEDKYWSVNLLAGASPEDKEIEQALLDLFRKPNPIRQTAFGVLCRVWPERALEFMTEALSQTEDSKLRSIALWWAWHNGLVPALDVCLKVLFEPTEDWANWLVYLIMQRHGEAARKEFEELLHSEDPEHRTRGAIGLIDPARQEPFDVLAEELTKKMTETATAGIAGRLAWVYGEKFAQWLEENWEQVADPATVLQAYVRNPQPTTSGLVEHLFQKGSPALQISAMKILVKQRGIEFLPQLRELIRKGKPGSVVRAAFDEIRFMGEAAYPAALEMLESENWSERKAGVGLLRDWSKLTPEQRERARNDPHIAVRNATR